MNYNNRYKTPFIISFIANILLVATLAIFITHGGLSKSQPEVTVTPAVTSAVSQTDVVSSTAVSEVSEPDVSPTDVSATDISEDEEITESSEAETTAATHANTDSAKKTTAKKTTAKKTTAKKTEPPVGDDNDGAWLKDWY